jgi:pimeloyl-ACP methyl ester carboxylesterase
MFGTPTGLRLRVVEKRWGVTMRRSIPFHSDISLAALLDLPDLPTFPLVVLLHGFTGWKEEEHIESLAYALRDAGIGAVHYDAPGFGESGGTLADDYRMTNYLASVPSVTSYAENELPLDGKPMGIWGHSMRGFVAVASAIKMGRFAAVCGSQSSVGKWRSTTNNEVEQWQKTGWATFPDERRSSTLELPYEFYLDRQQYDIFTMIDDLKAPLLLIAGTSDDVAPASQVKEIYAAAPEPKLYREFPTNHFYKFDETQLTAINEATVEFFARHLAVDS